jgi:hypothetical protein
MIQARLGSCPGFQFIPGGVSLPKVRSILGWTWIFISVFFLSGCATVGRWDSSLNLDINPIPVYRGKPAMARINAPSESKEVVGNVLVMGSPRLLFRKDSEKGSWYFYGTIPFSPWVKPGVYKIRVTVFPEQGEPHYTELKVELK